MMGTNEDFSAIVKESFAFLVDELGFSLVKDEWHQSSASWVVTYLGATRRFVQLTWGRKDAQFYFSVHRANDGRVVPAGTRGDEWFYIFELMHYLEPGRMWVKDLDIGDGPTDRERLHEKVRLNAEVLRRHGWEILQGTAWFDGEAKALLREEA